MRGLFVGIRTQTLRRILIKALDNLTKPETEREPHYQERINSLIGEILKRQGEERKRKKYLD